MRSWTKTLCSKVKVTRNAHAQLTTCYDSANHSCNDEKDGGTQYITFFSPFFCRGSCCLDRIWNNYVDVQDKNMQVTFIILLCTQGTCLATCLNTNWSECMFPDWSISWFFQRIGPNFTQKLPKWNEITCWIWLWMYQKQFVNLSTTFPVNRG